MFMNQLKELGKTLYDTERLQGCSREEVEQLKELFGALPPVLEEFYLQAADTPIFHRVQDQWILPRHFQQWDWLRQEEHLILLEENQGICRAGIRREDLLQSDPQVYVNNGGKDWELCAYSTSEFLIAALTYEAFFTFPHVFDDFLEPSQQEMELLQGQLTRRPQGMEHWLDCTQLSFYSNAPDNLAFVIDTDGYLQLFFGGVSRQSYEQLYAVMQQIDGSL